MHEVLDPAREKLGSPIVVNSGYRWLRRACSRSAIRVRALMALAQSQPCPKHNKEVGGVANSQHMRGEACDIRCTDNKRLVQIIEQGGKFDQLIIYPTLTSSSSDATRDSSSELGSPSLLPRFIHVSWKRSGKNRRAKLWSR